jgi:dolichol-phosphate mannosyltransferase
MLDERENVDGLCDRMALIQRDNSAFDFEFVLVDDGSSDGTGDAILARIQQTFDLRLIVFSRNFGAHAACTAGLDACRGDCAIVIGADLQEPPALVTQFLDRWTGGAEIVWGIRDRRAVESRLGPWVSRIFSKLFYRYSDLKSYPAAGPSGVLVDRAALEVFRRLLERHRNVYGLIAWVGFRQEQVLYAQLARAAGRSKWTLGKLLKLAIDSFVEFSYMPVRLVSALGFVVAGIGFVYAALLGVRALIGSHGPTGWTTVMVVVLILGGLQLLTLGVLGEYIWRGADETRGRPLYVIREEYRSDDSGSAQQHGPSTFKGHDVPAGGALGSMPDLPPR